MNWTPKLNDDHSIEGFKQRDMTELPKFTYRELRKEAERTVSNRKRQAPNRIMTGRLSNYTAGKQIAMMQAIVSILRELEDTEQKSTMLFF